MSEKKRRLLHVNATGDPRAGGVNPMIRFRGRWLREAGFQPGDTYEIVVHAPGVMTITTERARLRWYKSKERRKP